MTEEKRNYFVANDNGDLAGHDLSLEEAQAVLDRELQEDETNSQGREILSSDDSEG